MSVPNVDALMTCDNYLALDRYFHAFNRRAIPLGNKDRLIVVRPVLEYIRDRCKTLIVPSKNLSLDEGMMPYKGRLSIKVYNPKKPKKYGVKFFFVTESNTGYDIDFSIYSGVFSTLRDTVFGLVDRFRNQGYHLFMDNYYNSVSLAQELCDEGIHVIGTLRLVRGAPAVLQRLGQNPQQVKRGEFQWRHKGAVFVICWKGVRLVPMITTTHEAIAEDVVERRKTRRQGRVTYEEVTVQRPTVIGHYNRHMGGVDLFDQLVQYYPFTRRTRRWTHKLVKYLLQLAIQNAYVLYCGYTDDRRKMLHLQFMELVGNALVDFKDEEWPSITEGIQRAPDLPVAERADTYRMARPRRQRAARPRPADSSSDEEDLDDPAPADDSPPEPDAPLSPAAAAADAPADPDVAAAAYALADPDVAAAADPPVPDPPGDMPAPAHGPPSRRVVDPLCRLRRGDHTLVHLEGTAKQKRCRVCHLSGKRETPVLCAPPARCPSAGSVIAAVATILWKAQPAAAASALVSSKRAFIFLLHLNLVMSRGIKCKILQWIREKTRLKS